MRRFAAKVILGAGACIGVSLVAVHAEDKFPGKDIDVVLHAGVGGGTDIALRSVIPGFGEALGQRVNVLPKPGGNGVVSLKYMAEQPADGYTLMTLTASHFAAMAAGKSSWQFSDITCVGRLTDDVEFLMAKKGKYASAKELVADITSRPIKIGGAQIGGTDHIAVASLARKMPEGFKYTYIPFKAAPEIGAALVKGDVDVGTINYSEAQSMIDSGLIVPMLALSKERQAAQPDVPTSYELGIEAAFSSLRAIAMSSKVPQDRQKVLSEALVKGMQSDTYQNYLKGNGLDANTTADQEKCNAQLKGIYDDTAAALKEIGFDN